MSNQNAVVTPLPLQSGAIDFTYHFRPREAGGEAREPVSLTIPVPSVENLAALFSPEYDKPELASTREFALDAIHKQIIAHLKTKVDADEQFSQDSLDQQVGDINLFTIANIPRTPRAAITRAALEGLGELYVAVMTSEAVGVTQRAADNMAMLFVDRLKAVMGDEERLKVIGERLDLMVENTPADLLAEHEVAINYIKSRVSAGLETKIDLDDL